VIAGHDVARIRAENPSLLTLDGTNTWVAGRDPAWVVDPGPALPGHLDRIVAEIDARGGLGGIALTHRHPDHDEGVPALRERRPAPLVAPSGESDLAVTEGTRAGPFAALPTPGHSPDHVTWVWGSVAFTGDAVLGAGSVLVAGDMAGYLAALERLRDSEPDVLCPGHGPPVTDPHAKLDEYLAHRRLREDRLLTALAKGHRTVDDLLATVWDDAPPALRPAAALTLGAHLDKLEAEGRLPAGVERPGEAGALVGELRRRA